MLSRRSFVAAGLTLSAGGMLARPGAASVARALSLAELVGQSQHALVGASVDAFAQWETIGERRRIVTYTSLRVLQPIDGRKPPGDELIVRTLGGQVDDTGQVVPGEAVLARGEPAVTFLTPVDESVFAVTGLAQGHYRLLPDARGTRRLRATGSVELIGRDQAAAVHRLNDRTQAEAEALVREVLRAH